MQADSGVEVVDLSKNYGSVAALKSVSFKISTGQYFVLLGPSGGGKTTLLRLIGGFMRPSSGKILFRGQNLTSLPPNERPTSMVFQSYALFPHMTVEKNISYGLKLRKLPKAETASKVGRVLEMVGLEGLNSRCRTNYPAASNSGYSLLVHWYWRAMCCYSMNRWHR